MLQTERQGRGAKDGRTSSAQTIVFPTFHLLWVDMFGTFLIKQRRNKFKRYDAMFTCMAGWVVHIDITHSLDADSFIPALRRVIDRRGNNKTLFSDNGSNFVDCENELKKAYEVAKNQEIQSLMQAQGGEWIEWARNSPAISHIGGVWERKIRSS